MSVQETLVLRADTKLLISIAGFDGAGKGILDIESESFYIFNMDCELPLQSIRDFFHDVLAKTNQKIDCLITIFKNDAISF
ncbi:hypothetical protein [Herbaspirillum lusitanum]|uniref:hypothetical protein n=1 Tax=Herbaspirillum lusitanum TaxID=213312 RepID=UPI00035CCF83|nr:hypothetical protein [Herbaspirillum lusitanum]